MRTGDVPRGCEEKEKKDQVGFFVSCLGAQMRARQLSVARVSRGTASWPNNLLFSSPLTKSLLTMSLTPSVMEWKLSDLCGIDLPNVSSIPGVRLTRSKDYHKYHIDIAAFTEGNRKCIVENLHLETSEHEWLDSIQSSVTVL